MWHLLPLDPITPVQMMLAPVAYWQGLSATSNNRLSFGRLRIAHYSSCGRVHFYFGIALIRTRQQIFRFPIKWIGPS
jgi:hypothetical protein